MENETEYQKRGEIKLKKKFEVDTLLEKIAYGHCPTCIADENIFCNRDCDVKCLECSKGFCLGHIIQHGKEVHQMIDNNNHCSTVILN